MNRPFYTSFSWAYDLLIDEPVADRLQFIIEMLAQSGISGTQQPSLGWMAIQIRPYRPYDFPALKSHVPI